MSRDTSANTLTIHGEAGLDTSGLTAADIPYDNGGSGGCLVADDVQAALDELCETLGGSETPVDEVEFVATETATNGMLSVTVDKPAGTLADDLLLAYVCRENTSSVSSWAAITAPSGWTLLYSANSSSYNIIDVYWKLADVGEPADYTWSWGSSPALHAPWPGHAGIVAYRGTTGVIAASAINNNTASNVFTAPSVTAAANGSMLVNIFFFSSGGNPGGGLNPPGGAMTTRVDAPYSYTWLVLADEVVAAGATGTRAVGTTDTIAYVNQSISIALTPGTAVTSGVSGASYVTVDDETATLPNSFQLVAGDNVTLEQTTGQTLTIHAGGFPNATYLTEDDETADLPNSLRLVAGTNVSFDTDTSGNTLEISATAVVWARWSSSARIR